MISWDCKYQCCFLMGKVEKSTYSSKVLPTPLTGSLNRAAFMIHNLRKQELKLSSHPALAAGWLCARMFQTTSQWSKVILSSSHRTKTSLHFSTQGSLKVNTAKWILRIIKKGREKAKSLWHCTKSQGTTVWPGPFVLEKSPWRELQLRSKQILSGLNKE